MIRYALKCAGGHDFESWFQNADAFETLAGAGRLSCPECGSSEVTKSLMAPGVATSDKPTLAPVSKKDAHLAELRAKVEAECDYVGASFVSEARAIHEGEAPDRAIYGEAKPHEAISLIEEGIPVAPLPFLPTRKSN